MIKIYKDLNELSFRVAEVIINAGNKAIAKKGCFTLVLSGGETPKHIFLKFSLRDFTGALDWTKTSFFWVDERLVPPDDPQSNYGTAARLWLDHISHGPVFRMKGEAESAAVAAAKYQKLICSRFKLKKKALPRFDFILLGVGIDGHVASLFPQTKTLPEDDVLVIPTTSNETKQPRISMTFNLINQAKEIAVIASGAGKKEIIRRIVIPEEKNLLPVNKIFPLHGIFHLYLDRDAGSEIPERYIN